MAERRVLIAPALVVPGRPGDKVIRVRLTRKEVEHSPDVETALPLRCSSTRRCSTRSTSTASVCSTATRRSIRRTTPTGTSASRPGRLQTRASPVSAPRWSPPRQIFSISSQMPTERRTRSAKPSANTRRPSRSFAGIFASNAANSANSNRANSSAA